MVGAKRDSIARPSAVPGGGLTSKIVAVLDALELHVRFMIYLGQGHGHSGVPDLLTGLPFGALIDDNAFDAG